MERPRALHHQGTKPQKKATTVELSFAGETDVCWVRASKACSWSTDDEGATDSVVAPYWAVDFAKGDEKPNMDLKPIEIKVTKLGDTLGLAANTLRLVTRPGAQGNGVLKIFALTNTRRLKSGEVLLRKDR